MTKIRPVHHKLERMDYYIGLGFVIYELTQDQANELENALRLQARQGGSVAQYLSDEFDSFLSGNRPDSYEVIVADEHVRLPESRNEARKYLNMFIYRPELVEIFLVEHFGPEQSHQDLVNESPQVTEQKKPGFWETLRSYLPGSD